jgi:hypothetical protein
MHLVLYSTTAPPGKEYWHSVNAKDRKDWHSIYESLTAWFCLSNGFRKGLNADILLNGLSIHFKGDELRYFSPSLRSAASLIYKAYETGNSFTSPTKSESTPGIYVSNIENSINYVKPWYHYKLNSHNPTQHISGGTLFWSKYRDSIPVEVPASTLAQAIIWTHYGGYVNGNS